MRRSTLGVVVLALAAAPWVIAACVDLDSLGAGGARPMDATTEQPAEGDAESRPFCEAALSEGAVFCDDFDRPDYDPKDRWPGLIVGNVPLLPSVTLLGSAGFQHVEERVPPSTPPWAIAFTAERPTKEAGRAYVAFGKAFRQGELSGRVVVASADIRVAELSASAPDVGDAADLADAGDAAAAPDANEAGPGGPADVPSPNVTVLGLISAGPTFQGVNLTVANVASNNSQVYVSAGADERALDQGSFDAGLSYLNLAALTWTRVWLAVGEPDAVAAYVDRTVGAQVVCPKDTGASVAAWASLPLKAAVCVRAPSSFVPLAEGTVGVSLGAGVIQTGNRARVLIDSVRVDVVP